MLVVKRENAEHLLKEIEAALADPATTREQREELDTKYLETKMRLEQSRNGPQAVEIVEVDAKPGFAWKEAGATGDRWKRLPPTFEGSPRLARIMTERLSEATAREVLAHAGVAVGDAISEDTAKRIRQTALEMDEHFRVEFAREPNGQLVLTLLAR
jgi:hypothetical protein